MLMIYDQVQYRIVYTKSEDDQGKLLYSTAQYVEEDPREVTPSADDVSLFFY